ncbi:uncharacterized protein LOC126375392 [Pectinophora gossypiella]|uniref:uncharacterized protein LOC126375392 n=1 Tax=Pectinophora gossypiella TaxID=13191 RepID=UPI00214E14A1|nr:uncharacterized protein LOC126375392 [Pectinophora gossypiella]
MMNNSTAVKYRDEYYNYSPYNATRTVPPGIAAYRSALTLDWLAAEDSRQRELVAAIESEPFTPTRLSHSDCISYSRPPSGTVARLMLELLKNLEGDDGNLVPSLIQALVRSKLLMLETSMFDNEPDLDSLVKTPAAMMGEPHTTFPRILATMWMAVTDPSTVKKHGWCTINRMTMFLGATKPSDVAKHLRAIDPIVARARFIMEEFIQHVTPLNMLQKPPEHANPRKLLAPNPALKPRYKPGANPQPRGDPQNARNNKRLARTQPTNEQDMKNEDKFTTKTDMNTAESSTIPMPLNEPQMYVQSKVISSLSTLPEISKLLFVCPLLLY